MQTSVQCMISMTGRTHDLAAFTLLNTYIATQPVPHMTIATAVAALAGNMVGGITPDLDQPTSQMWNRIPAGSIIGRILSPLLGSHRLVSHSLVGMIIIGYLLRLGLGYLGKIILVDMTIVWWAFMIGYASHLIADSFTTEGVPWLFPIPFRFGFPPFSFLRIKTGGMIEKGIVFPGLMIFNGYLIYHFYTAYFILIKSFVR